MPRLRVPVALLAVLASLPAQGPEAVALDPVQLVARAEQLCTGADREAGVLLLWEGLEQMTKLAESPARTAAMQAARALLKTHDPLHSDRLAAFIAIAKAQAELAASYRLKKWFDAAAERLDFAEPFDRELVVKERAQLAAVRPKVLGNPVNGNPLFRRQGTSRASGPWKESADLLECAGHTAGKPIHEWIIDAPQDDCEVSVEFRAHDAKDKHDAGILVGLDTSDLYYHVIAAYYAEYGNYTVTVFEMGEGTSRRLGESVNWPAVTADGFHRLTVRVRGNSLRAWFDGDKPVEAKTRVVPRGRFGLVVGISNQDSMPITFRKLRRTDPPDEEPVDAVQRAEMEVAVQDRVGKLLNYGRALLERKEGEGAAQSLREAQVQLARLPAGVLRDNLAQQVEKLLVTADPLVPRRKKAAQDAAKALLALADRHAAAGWQRAAHRLVVMAAEFDPEGCKARLLAAQQASDTARASLLLPPADDGTVLRDWFGKGSRFLPQAAEWTVEGASARALVPARSRTVWLAKEGVPGFAKASVSVLLPAVGASAGFCCEVRAEHDYSTVRLLREGDQLLFEARHLSTGSEQQLLAKWVPVEAWRMGGWFEITLERTAQGITARCGGVTLELDHRLLPPKSDRLALFAANDAAVPVTLEIRAFRVQ